MKLKIWIGVSQCDNEDLIIRDFSSRNAGIQMQVSLVLNAVLGIVPSLKPVQRICEQPNIF